MGCTRTRPLAEGVAKCCHHQRPEGLQTSCILAFHIFCGTHAFVSCQLGQSGDYLSPNGLWQHILQGLVGR